MYKIACCPAIIFSILPKLVTGKLSESIFKKSKGTYNRPATMQDLCKALRDFYTLALIDFSKYSSLSETSANYESVHKAYSIMKKELNIK